MHLPNTFVYRMRLCPSCWLLYNSMKIHIYQKAESNHNQLHMYIYIYTYTFKQHIYNVYIYIYTDISYICIPLLFSPCVYTYVHLHTYIQWYNLIYNIYILNCETILSHITADISTMNGIRILRCRGVDGRATGRGSFFLCSGEAPRLLGPTLGRVSSIGFHGGFIEFFMVISMGIWYNDWLVVNMNNDWWCK